MTKVTNLFTLYDATDALARGFSKKIIFCGDITLQSPKKTLTNASCKIPKRGAPQIAEVALSTLKSPTDFCFMMCLRCPPQDMG